MPTNPQAMNRKLLVTAAALTCPNTVTDLLGGT
jgi:hypothetical protein